jgi:hypothetical protein
MREPLTNLRQAVMPLSSDSVTRLIEFVEEKQGTVMVYQDDHSNPGAVIIPWSRFAELLGIETLFETASTTLTDPPEIDGADVVWDITPEAVPGGAWSVQLIHKPTGIELGADSSTDKSLLAAQVRLWKILPFRIREKE